MKARIPKSNAYCKSTDNLDDIYKSATDIAVRHTLAYCLRTLEKSYGFRKNRLEKFMVKISNVIKDAVECNDMSSSELLQYMKEQYNIDIENLTID